MRKSFTSPQKEKKPPISLPFLANIQNYLSKIITL